MKSLIINADDFGLSHSVNNAVMAAFNAGNLTSATLMMNTAATAEAVLLAKQNPALGVGLHFNLTLGQAMSEDARNSGLTDANGNFLHRDELSRKLLRNLIPERVIEAELTAQFDAMVAEGLMPSHIDGHQHIQAFPKVFDGVARRCVKHNIPVRVPWLLLPASLLSRPGRFFRQSLLRIFLYRNKQKWRQKLKWNTQLASMFDLGPIPEHIGIEDYRKLLAHAYDGVFELMVHPAEHASDMQGLTAIGALSELEGAFLKNDKLADLAKSMGFALKTYKTADFNANKAS